MRNTIDNLKLQDNLRTFQRLQFKELYENIDNYTSIENVYIIVLDSLNYYQVSKMCSILAQAVLPTLKSKEINLDNFQEKLSYGDQAADEARLVLEEYEKVKGCTRLTELRACAIEMLQLIIEGFAVLPDIAARRELFDWWLNDVVPAAYNLTEPDKYPREIND